MVSGPTWAFCSSGNPQSIRVIVGFHRGDPQALEGDRATGKAIDET
jgi:hypothetical protein